MKKFFVFAAAVLAAVMMCGTAAFAGTWVRDEARPANQGGLTNWQWKNNDGSSPKAQWAWIDGNGDGLCESYYFNEEGYMMAAPARPQNYAINDQGAWMLDGVVQVYPNEWAPGPVLTADTINSVTAGKLNAIDAGYPYDYATHSTMNDTEAYKKLMQLKAKYPEGTPWDPYKTYISGERYGYGCAAFIYMVQDYLYGAPARPMIVDINNLNMDAIRIGDHLRVENNTHSVIVLSKGDGYITVAEGEFDHMVRWSRRITEEELRRQYVFRETCY